MITKNFLGILVIFLAAGCTSTNKEQGILNPQALNQSAPEASPLHTTQAVAFDPVSLPALMQKQFDGRELKLGKVLLEHQKYTRYYITYKSGELTISGILNVPKGTPPAGGFPVLFLNHGHIDTSVYTNGRGLKREQDYLAGQGFAVLHSDYRNHAESSKDPESENNFRLGYTEDVINAVLAVKNSNLTYLSKEKFGMLGHSMGGGITQNVLVVKPGLVKAAVLYAPVSPRLSDNFERWTLGTRKISESIMEKYPAPQESICEDLIAGVAAKSKEEAYVKNVALWCQGTHDESFWSDLSAEKFFSNIQIPILYFHGDADESVPVDWSRRSLKTLQDLEKNVELVEYKGQPHEFTPPTWNRFMERSTTFFKENL
jgi:dipeptidyl aminopeptidase/acylaminoacyl peptidase